MTTRRATGAQKQAHDRLLLEMMEKTTLHEVQLGMARLITRDTVRDMARDLIAKAYQAGYNAGYSEARANEARTDGLFE